jgi:DNA-binding NtrC family response regulator
MKKRILVIDDEPGVRASLTLALAASYDVITSPDGREGLALFQSEVPDLVLLDIAMPDDDGLAVLRTMQDEDRRIPMIMLTAITSVKTAVTAMKLGAADYLTKPFDIEELRLVVGKALATRALEQEVQELRAQVKNRYGFHNLIHSCPN